MKTPAIAAALSLLAPVTVAAQRISIEVVPKVGVATPLGSLTENAELSTAFTFGVAVELVLADLPFGVRANVDRISSADIRERGSTELQLGSADITQITGDLVVRPLPALVGASPYLLAGAGVRSYEIDVAEGELALLRSSFRRFTGHLGGGVDVRIGPATVVAEVADYISTFVLPDGESKLQNDIVGLIGLRVRMF